MIQQPKIIVIVGPTASGKTSLSIQLAKTYHGEIISADSRQVYRGLNIGTGKVTTKEMDGVPHHLLDVADPNDTYTVADYVRDADDAITHIISRDKIPVIVGGTFLYIDTLLGKITTPDVPPNETFRKELETFSNEDLVARLKALDPERHAHIDIHNRRRLIRALEIVEARGSVPKQKPIQRYTALILGIDIEKEALHAHIHTRLLSRMEEGMLNEAITLHENGLSYERMEDLGLEYRYLARYLQNKITYEVMLSEIETKSIQYAKRQMTWLKRDKSIIWIKTHHKTDIRTAILHFLQN